MTAQTITYDCDLKPRAAGWVVIFQKTDIEIEAFSTQRKHSNVPAVVTLRRDGEAIETDEFALTKAKRRAAFVARPAVQKVGIPDQALEGALLQLCDALKEAAAKPHATAPAIVPAATLGDPIPKNIEEVLDLIGQRLMMGDPAVLHVVLGVVKAHRVTTGAPAWLMLVGPPSGLKSELVRLLDAVPGTYALSGLTSKTFASGLKVDKGQPSPSLLSKLRDEVLLFKDFTTILQMHREERDAILSQLREIFDGKFEHDWGTGERLQWTGRLGFIAGVTEAIDSHHSVMGLLGPRFVLYRVTQAERAATARRAIRNNENPDDSLIRARHARAIAAYLQAVPSPVVPLADEIVDTLSRLSDFVTTARSAVQRDGNSRELTYTPAPEMPGRFAQQLSTLLTGIALVRQHAAIDATDVQLVARVAIDAISPVRRLALVSLFQGDTDLTTSVLAENVRVPTTTIRRAMEDLQALGMVRCHKGGRADRWSLLMDWRPAVAEFLDTVPETSGGCEIEKNLREVVV